MIFFTHSRGLQQQFCDDAKAMQPQGSKVELKMAESAAHLSDEITQAHSQKKPTMALMEQCWRNVDVCSDHFVDRSGHGYGEVRFLSNLHFFWPDDQHQENVCICLSNPVPHHLRSSV